ncbi:MAG: alkaline phosphatase family protein [Candidatus Eremiobacteraeota bacterium]|nr:alkaline phosphatase family protein [Candidatus Eremiobacteraeota bacterium]
MSWSIRSLFASLLLAGLGAGAATRVRAQPAAAARPDAPLPRPTLVVFLTVDQMRADYLTTRFGSGLTGGLKRLRDGGALFTNAHQDHAITETAPGHATTLSGRFPSHTGIVRNATGVQDPQAPLLAGGVTGPASPFRFRGSTLVDWMRSADPRSRALSVSRKDRGAIFPMGRAKQHVFWYGGNGRFVTSRYYDDTLPDWVKRFDGDSAGGPLAPLGTIAARYAGRAWTPLLAASAYPEPDSVPVENGGHDYTFPHVLTANPAVAVRDLAEFPWMDEATLGFALAGVRALKLGAGPSPDVLAISLSTTDAIGHRYGPDSRELHDQIIRLDRMLGAFFNSLYSVRDSSRIVVALTADHGVAPFPELYTAQTHRRAGHVDASDLLHRARTTLVERGIDSTALSFEDGMLFVRRESFARAGFDAAAVIDPFVSALRRRAGVLRVDRVRDLARDSASNPISRRWLHMVSPDLPVEYVATLSPYSVWGSVTYAEHGTPHDYDTHVPVIFYGPPFRPGRYPEFARVVDMAPTLAWIAHVTPSDRLDGRVLRAAIR